MNKDRSAKLNGLLEKYKGDNMIGFTSDPHTHEVNRL